MNYQINPQLSAEEFNKKYKINKEFAAKLVFSENSKSSNSIAGKPKILAIEILKRFFSNPVVLISTIVFLGIIITAIVVKYTSPYLPGHRLDAEWKAKGYQITGTSLNSIKSMPPSFAPMKEFTGRNNEVIVNINRFTSKDYIFYEYLKPYLIEGKTYIIDPASDSQNPIYKVDIYKYWQASEINAFMAKLRKETSHPFNLTKGELDGFYLQAKDALDQVSITTVFGTTEEGYDIWTTVWAGTLESLWIALIVATVETIIGVFVGAILGFYAGKWIDTVFSRLIEIFQAPPSIIWLLMFVSIWGTSAPVLIAGLLFVGWTYPISSTRLFIITVKDEEYITAAKSIGASPMRRIFDHALPAVVGKISQSYVRRIPSVIISIASLAFLGFFNDPNSYNLGKFMLDNISLASINPWVMILPASILLFISISLQFVALGLHDALDPKVIKLKK
ncbi:ABC transporter permease [Mycoplasmopsis felifaucium]|uniref:ABC transporter permease n=1 Tax=Mycoplasmopsis felifaucium TaxID=35768 RepID=UPI000A9BDFAD|nr:ABC transporter permease [Mycoplasmopsis felifaucium]